MDNKEDAKLAAAARQAEVEKAVAQHNDPSAVASFEQLWDQIWNALEPSRRHFEHDWKALAIVWALGRAMPFEKAREFAAQAEVVAKKRFY